LQDAAMAHFHVLTSGRPVANRIAVRRIAISDVLGALRAGYDDFVAQPSFYVFAVLLYPFMALALALFVWASNGSHLHLIYPLVTGFALLGPVAAIGLYEVSRRREAGLDPGWRQVFSVARSPALPAIAAVALWLLVLFLSWIWVAGAIYHATFGDADYAAFGAMLGDVLSTPRGLILIVLGNLAGLGFAVVTLCTTVIAFPLLLDRDVGALAAVLASAVTVARNPLPMMAWALIVVTLLLLGALVLLVGLVVVLPVLGHATWHLYRRIVPAPG
jgi:uncharacterized membrane protein